MHMLKYNVQIELILIIKNIEQFKRAFILNLKILMLNKNRFDFHFDEMKLTLKSLAFIQNNVTFLIISHIVFIPFIKLSNNHRLIGSNVKLAFEIISDKTKWLNLVFL
jgi:hypothetical protein